MSSSASLGWRARAIDWRTRMLSSPRFHKWAAAFPFTRPVARRQARAVFDLVAGFVYSQVLFACVRLDLLGILLRDGPQTAASLALRLNLTPEATARLLDAAASLKLVVAIDGERFALGERGAPIAGSSALRAMIEHHELFYADLRDPVALLRGDVADTSLARFWPYAGSERPAQLDESRVGAYSELMSASQSLVADEILDGFSLAGYRCLLDVGGGHGTFLQAVARRYPKLQLLLFDLPAVAQRAAANFSSQGMAARATTTGGDFFRDALPVGADVISLVRVLHDHDDDRVSILLRAAWMALPANGTLLIAEPLSGVPGAEPVGDAYFGFYLLAMGSGRARSVESLSRLLASAGFAKPGVVPTRLPLQTSLLVTKKISA